MLGPFTRSAALMRRLRAEERGQSLVIIAVCMTAMMGASAMAIDVASWYAKHHQAQVAADAAALAAANCLARAGVSGNPCTSTSDTSDAQALAVSYAAKNGITITPSDVSVNTSTDTVTVTANTDAPAFFASLFGIHTATMTAGSGASFKPPTTSTTVTPTTTTVTTTGTSSGNSACTASNASQCSVIYTANPTCSSGDGITLGTSSSGGAALSISGVIHSEGEMTISNNFSVTPTASLTVAGSCYSSGTYPTANTNSTPSKLTATQVASETWPVNYAASPYFTACTTSCTTVTGVADVPSYCTQATTSSTGFTFYQNNGVYVLPQNGNVYCAIGSGTPSNPATWNGPITFETSVPQYGSGCSSSSNSSFTSATFIGGAITSENSEVCMTPALYNCLFYSTSSITLYNGQFYWAGDIFDPGGTVQIGTASSGGEQMYSVPSGMIEAENFTIQNGQIDQMQGDGPVISGSGTGTTTTSTTTETTSVTTTTTTPGTDSLTQ